MPKQKNSELDFLYKEEQYKPKNKKRKKVKNKKNKLRADQPSAQSGETFNFDNEIVIGVTKIPDEKNKNNNKRNSKTKGNYKKSTKGITKKKTNKINKKKEEQENVRRNSQSQDDIKYIKKKNKKRKLVKNIVKWAFLLSALAGAFVFFMMSPLFDLATVQVINNDKISSDTIISLSGLIIGENIYKTSYNQIEKNIKQNAYIENVKVKRQLPNKIEITVKERKATYMLEYATSFAYINNQGYILEISEEKLNVPIIVGYTTNEEEIKTGGRINSEDLEKLSTVLKIMESVNANGIGELISKIDIKNKQNYTLILEDEKKTVYLGDASNLSNRMLYLKAILEQEKGVEGEIFINGDLNKQDVYFRMKQI